MDAVIIGNPNSGRGGDRNRLERYAKILGERGDTVEVWNTEHPNHATSLATEAGDRLVIAAGGDGTVNEVLNGLSDGAALGILPLGTANVLARELGLPLKPEDACRRILDGQRERIDLGVATDREGTERRFACMAGLGFDADVVRTVPPRLKRYLKALAFPITGFRVWLEGDLPPIHVIDGDTIYVTQFAVVANGHYYGGEFRLGRGDGLTSGELETILVERVSLLLRPDVLARLVSRKPLNRSMRSFTTQDLRARAPGADVPVQIDGEVWGRLPMSFRVEPGALQVVH